MKNRVKNQSIAWYLLDSIGFLYENYATQKEVVRELFVVEYKRPGVLIKWAMDRDALLGDNGDEKDKLITDDRVKTISKSTVSNFIRDNFVSARISPKHIRIILLWLVEEKNVLMPVSVLLRNIAKFNGDMNYINILDSLEHFYPEVNLKEMYFNIYGKSPLGTKLVLAAQNKFSEQSQYQQLLSGDGSRNAIQVVISAVATIVRSRIQFFGKKWYIWLPLFIFYPLIVFVLTIIKRGEFFCRDFDMRIIQASKGNQHQEILRIFDDISVEWRKDSQQGAFRFFVAALTIGMIWFGDIHFPGVNEYYTTIGLVSASIIGIFVMVYEFVMAAKRDLLHYSLVEAADVLSDMNPTVKDIISAIRGKRN